MVVLLWEGWGRVLIHVYGVAAHRALAYSAVHQDIHLLQRQEHELRVPLVPTVATKQVFNPLHSPKRTSSVYELGEQEGVHAPRWVVVPSNGRGRGRRPREAL